MNKRKLRKKIETLMYVIEKQEQAIRSRDEQIKQLSKFTHDEMIDHQVNKILLGLRES